MSSEGYLTHGAEGCYPKMSIPARRNRERVCNSMHVAMILGASTHQAAQRGFGRALLPVEGAEALLALVEAAARAEVQTLTLYTFAAVNLPYPSAEADALMRLFHKYLMTGTARCLEQSIRIHVIGRRDRLKKDQRRAIEHCERLTAAGSRLQLRIVLDYSSHDRIVHAAWRANRSPTLTPQDFYRRLQELDPSVLPAGGADLLIRTGGELRRLSDFMLWEVAYAQLHFTDCPWPDFDEQHFQCALKDFAARQRRGTFLGRCLARDL